MNYTTPGATGQARDQVDHAVAQWVEQRPDLDFSAMGVIARLARLNAVGGRAIDRVFESAGVDRGEFNVLASLRREGAPFQLTPSELTDRDLTTRGGMTKRLDRLESRGLVVRRANGADRRSLLVSLTAAGLEVIDRLIEQHTANQAAALSVLSAEQRQALDDAVRRLLSTLEGTHADADAIDAGSPS